MGKLFYTGVNELQPSGSISLDIYVAHCDKEAPADSIFFFGPGERFEEFVVDKIFISPSPPSPSFGRISIH